MQWGIGGAAALSLVFALTGPAIIDLMTTSPQVREAARACLPWLVAAPRIGAAVWVPDGIFIGAMLAGDMLRTMLISVAVHAVALAILVPPGGNQWLWAGLMVLNAVRTYAMWRRCFKVLALVAN